MASLVTNSTNNEMADLFNKYRLDLRRHLSLKMNLIPDDADDIIQETFARLMKIELETDKQVCYLESPKAYIFQTAINLAIDRIRRRRVRVDEGYYQPLSDDMEEHTLDLVRAIDAEKRLNQLLEVVDNLPPKCRKVFILHKFKQMTYKEVAEHMNISQSMVEKHMMKALGICDNRLKKR